VSLGPLLELRSIGIVSLFYEWCVKLLWFVVSDGTVNLTDNAHAERSVTEYIRMFKSLPLAGADTTVYEKILGNGLNTRLLAIVSDKYVRRWKCCPTGCCLQVQLPNDPVSCVHLFHDLGEGVMVRQKRVGSPIQQEIPLVPPRTTRAKVGSSFVAPGLHIPSGAGRQ
jgi:hypothetical protein